MSLSNQGGASGDACEENKVLQRSRQPNGATLADPPVRRSWRPCQMLNQDGEPDPHHHHHHHHPPHRYHHPQTGRGPPRYRRRPPSGQSQSHPQHSGQVQTVTPSRPDGTESQDTEPRPIQQPRPAVARYRRHGDPNPRLRGQRRRQQVEEVQNSSDGADKEGVSLEVQRQQQSSPDPIMDQSQDRKSPHQTQDGAVTPVHLSLGPSNQNPPTHPGQSPSVEKENIQGYKTECGEEFVEVKKEDEQEQADDDGGHRSDTCRSSCSHEDMQAANDEAEMCAEGVEGDQEAVTEVAEDVAAQGSEITDLCSDTESAASLSMDGPLHSPPPLHSPTPPSSPDVPTFPQLHHFSEDASLSPLPDNDLLPEEEEDDDNEDCAESCSLSHFTSCPESYPKTYADFYSELHQKPYSEPVFEAKSHPDSFPEPLKTSYPELHREPHRSSGWRTEPSEVQHESRQEPFTNHRHENVQKGTPSSHHVSRQGRDRASHHPPLDRSVGCRLHHYDGKSEGEDSADQSPVHKSHRLTHRQAETQVRSPESGENGPDVAREEQNTVGPQDEEGPRVSGDAITLAIKDIKEAIEEVKTKAVRSPYTPDKPVEPIWVMRQEFSPTEDVYPLQTAGCHSSPHTPSQSESPSRYASFPTREPASPSRDESARSLHPEHYHHQQPQHDPQHHKSLHSEQRDTARPPQPHAHTPQQMQHQQQHQQIRRSLPQFPTFVDVPGPCDPEDLIDGIIFAATYLGCTHLLSERTPTKSARMQQAQEAMNRVRAAQKQAKNRKKSPDGEVPSTAEVDLFMSTQRIKVLNADTQESLMDLPLRTISYIADIGNMVVLMARGKMVRSRSAQDHLDHTAEQTSMTHDDRRLYRMICHVFESEDAQLIAQSIGQSFSVAYQEFLRANGIDPEDLSQREYSDLLNTQDMYNDDLIHFSKSENCRDVYIEKQKGEILGVVIVESGWGSILPTVIIASMMHAGPAEKSGRLNIGDQIMTVNGTSLVGLPLNTCQSIIKGLKSQSRIKLNIVRCPPVTLVLIRRPDLRYQLGFSVQNGIICSLMRGGIAERGGVRVGHRIIEINSQSVVATPHEKIVQILSNAMGEIHMKTMPAAMYRLLTAQEQPVYI
ncbi:amyloid-beta A4 precursor protein-binding family A member 1-like isoform X2 [Antennarius striatus]|uniref:amyloid-beta A4 precursor protein-binding family A member 1-like isoform X2 n=1 Tax=Antennarius striatus TaxID=241820 RepID=UPI0035B4A3B7